MTVDPRTEPRHLALVGCTASGKSLLAAATAERLGDVEIVTVDSMQVYRGMDIGTAKPDVRERAGVPHHLFDVADPSEDFSVARFASEARKVIAEVGQRGKRALLVGGTGLYLRSVVDNLEPPGTFPEVRARLESDPDTAGLHRQLQRLDCLAASRMEATNRRRVIRALEVCLGSGRPFSTYGPGLGFYAPANDWRVVGIWLPRAVVARRIEQRYAAMLDAGLIDEVRSLAARPAGISRTARQALGYRELLAHLDQGLPLAEANDLAIRRTRAFARRQRMWWRRDPRIVWLGAGDNPFAVLPLLLGHWSQP